MLKRRLLESMIPLHGGTGMPTLALNRGMHGKLAVIIGGGTVAQNRFGCS